MYIITYNNKEICRYKTYESAFHMAWCYCYFYHVNPYNLDIIEDNNEE